MTRWLHEATSLYAKYFYLLLVVNSSWRLWPTVRGSCDHLAAGFLSMIKFSTGHGCFHGEINAIVGIFMLISALWSLIWATPKIGRSVFSLMQISVQSLLIWDQRCSVLVRKFCSWQCQMAWPQLHRSVHTQWPKVYPQIEVMMEFDLLLDKTCCWTIGSPRMVFWVHSKAL